MEGGKEKPLYKVLSELENEVKKNFGEIFQNTMDEILNEEGITNNEENEELEEKAG